MSGSVKTKSAPVSGEKTAAPAAASARPSSIAGLQSLAGSASNATIARAISAAPGRGGFATPPPITAASGLAVARNNEGAATPDAPAADAQSAAKKALEDPIDLGLGILDKAIGGQLKNGQSKEWTSSKNWGGDTWKLPQIDIPLVKVIQVYVGGSATAHAGIGARGKVEAKREEQGADQIKDTLTVTGNANVTGGIEGSLRAGVSVGLPKIATISAGVSGSMKLDGKGTMDVNATLTRSGKVGSLGNWTASGGYKAKIDGALTAQLKGEITWKVLWWDGTIASFNIANWNLGKAGVTIKGDIATSGAPKAPKVSWTFNPPSKPPLAKSGNMNPKPHPDEKANASRKVAVAAGGGAGGGDGDGLPRNPFTGAVLARKEDDQPAGAAPSADPGAAPTNTPLPPPPTAPPAESTSRRRRRVRWVAVAAAKRPRSRSSRPSLRRRDRPGACGSRVQRADSCARGRVRRRLGRDRRRQAAG